MQVHKEKVDKVPNSLPGRNNIEIEIYGMEGIPEDDVKEHERQKMGKGDGGQHSRQMGDEDDDDMGGMQHGPGMGMPPGGPGRPPMMPPGMPPGPMGMPPMGMPPMPGMGPMGPMPPMGPMGPMGPMPPPMMPPRGMMPPGSWPSGPPPSTSQSNTAAPINMPAKPLFPSAGQSQVRSSAPPVGPDFKPRMPGPTGINSASTTAPASIVAPPKPTFPAYSAETTTAANISAPPLLTNTTTLAATIKKPESSSGMTIKLIHPDEDISLEERRARLFKYRSPGQIPMSGIPSNVSVPSLMSQPPVPGLGMGMGNSGPGGLPPNMSMMGPPPHLDTMVSSHGPPSLMSRPLMPPQSGRY